MNRAVGYGRVSTLGQATDGTSSDEQKRIITEECERKGWELVRFYSDEGYSGKNTLRPGFVQLLMDAKAGKFDTVVFTKLDRFGRSLKDMLNNLSELSDLDIRIYCINQPEINADGALGKALLQFLGIFAEFEHAMIAERTKQGRKAAWKSGQSFIGTMPFGYKLDRENGNKIIINKEQKAVYDKIVSMYLAERLPTTAIALELNRQQLPPPTNRGMRRWYYLTIIRILKNPVYTGTVTYNKTKLKSVTTREGKQYYIREKNIKDSDDWITVKYPPFITQARFDEIQELIKMNTKTPLKKYKDYEDHFLLEKGLLYCGECGGRMGKYLRKLTNSTRFFYRCYWKTHGEQAEISLRKKCSVMIDADKTDNYVLYQIFNFLSDPSKFAQAWFKDLNLEELQGNLNRLKKEKEAEEKALKRLYQRFATMDKPEILEATMRTHEERDKEISIELERVQKEYNFARNKHDRFHQFEEAYKSSVLRQKIKVYYQTQKQFMDFLDKLTFEHKQKIVEAVVSPENGGKITAYRSYEEGNKAIDLEIDFNADFQRIENLILSFEDRKGQLRYNITQG